MIFPLSKSDRADKNAIQSETNGQPKRKQSSAAAVKVFIAVVLQLFLVSALKIRLGYEKLLCYSSPSKLTP